MDDSSATSSASEPQSPDRAGLGGEAGKQRQLKKKRKGHDEAYAFFNTQENNLSRSDKRGTQDKEGREMEEDEDEEENWEWEIRESGAGGRVKGRKVKSRARLPEEWGAPQLPASTTAAPEVTPPNSRPSSAQGPTTFTSPLTDSLARSYEPMCVGDFLMSCKDAQQANNNVSNSNVAGARGSSSSKTASAGNVGGSLALATGDSLSPVSQTFSFLDSVLQTSPVSTLDSQTNTPSLAAASQARSIVTDASSAPQPPQPSSSDLPHASALPHNIGTVQSALNVNAKPFVPSVSPLSTVSPYNSDAVATTSFSTSLKSVCPNTTSLSSATPPPSITPAHSEHPESSSPQLPPLEGW